MPLTVNDEPVPDQLIDAEFGQIKASYEQMGNMSCCERDEEFLGYARDNLIGRTLLGQHARLTMPAPSAAEIDDALVKAKEEHGGEEHFFFNIGITPDQEDKIRPQVAESLQLDHLLLSLTSHLKSPTEDELRAFYEAHLDRFTGPEEVRASHIFRNVERVEERENILTELRQVRKKALAGEDFDELAREYSDKAEDEIDLGFFKRGDLMDEFEIMAFSMEIDEISPTLASPWGLHLVKLTERKSPAPLPYEECRAAVEESFILQRRQDTIQTKVDELKKSATIVLP